MVDPFVRVLSTNQIALLGTQRFLIGREHEWDPKCAKMKKSEKSIVLWDNMNLIKM